MALTLKGQGKTEVLANIAPCGPLRGTLVAVLR
jgi:hypothetical protein